MVAVIVPSSLIYSGPVLPWEGSASLAYHPIRLTFLRHKYTNTSIVLDKFADPGCCFELRVRLIEITLTTVCYFELRK